MPLAFSLRDEENERINNILKQLIGTDYVPDLGNESINEILKGLAIDLQTLLTIDSAVLVSQLQKLHFDWENAEQFADFLIALSDKLPASDFALKAKAVAIYEYVQSGSKVFSFNISKKIATAKQ